MNLRNVRGIGKVTLEKLNRININDVNDMIFCFPKKYEINYIDNIENKEINKQLILKAKIIDQPKLYYIRKKLTKLSLSVISSNLKFTVVIFNREFLSKILKSGDEIVITGKFIKNYNTFSSSNLALLSNFKGGIIPQYNLKEISDGRVHNIVSEIFKSDIQISDNLPLFLKNKHNFPDIKDTIRKIHFPQSIDDVKEAKYRLAYEEFLFFGVRIAAIKKMNERLFTPIKKYNIELVKKFINTLPFELTIDQKEATNDIFKDFKKKTRMNRLLQGDVGSGKTIVSIISAYAVITANYQVAILAPTLVLAKQHYDTFLSYLKNFSVNIELLTSETDIRERTEIIKRIRMNECNIVIGTHSLLNEEISFANLGFVVIDEQQRFGVEQRRIIREKGIHPDILMMSATPIPRTLAISLFENTDISTIKEKPKDRKRVLTKIFDFENIEKAFRTVDSELEKNRQVYVICPLISPNENTPKISVNEALKMFKTRFKTAKIDILHGKMSDEEKTSVLNNFYRNEINIIISTTVVEVGVNVMNASTMIILNANNFGLAQLHQLRGRIGRNNFNGYCYLIVDDLAVDLDKMKILEETNDGFVISEYDLSIRGPGEVFGKLQSGIPNFQFANIVTDTKLRDIAFSDAEEILNSRDSVSKQIYSKVIKSIETYNLD